MKEAELKEDESTGGSQGREAVTIGARGKGGGGGADSLPQTRARGQTWSHCWGSLRNALEPTAKHASSGLTSSFGRMVGSCCIQTQPMETPVPAGSECS